MVLKLTNVSIEGFRGFNEKSIFPLEGGVTLFYGKNGQGKSSFFQSIEWCLTGELPYFSTPDFAKEDAIVNEFAQKKIATVTITAEEGKRKLLITRTRKMGKSSTRGTSSLNVNLDGTTYKDDEALQQIEKRFGVVTGEFSRVFYLHQESIQEILSMDPKERSRGVDRLLGTFEIREFAEALDLDRYFNKKTKSLDEQLDRIGADKQKLAGNMRKLLLERKKKLLDEGFGENELAIDSTSVVLSSIVSDTLELASRYDLNPRKIEYPLPDVARMKETAGVLELYLRELDQKRIRSSTDLDRRIDTIGKTKNSYEEAKRELASIGQQSLESLNTSKAEVMSQLQGLEPKVRELDRLVTNLIGVKSEVSTSNQNISVILSKSKQMTERDGDLAEIRSKLQTLRLQSEEIRRSIDSSSKLTQLLVLGMSYLLSERPCECPLCQQPIDPQKVIQSLEERNKTKLAQSISDLESQRSEVERKVRETKTTVEELEQLERRLASEQQSLDRSLSNLRRLVEEKESVTENYPFDAQIEKTKQTANDLRGKTITLNQNLSDLDKQIGDLRKSMDAVSRSQRLLQVNLATELEGDQLIKLAVEKTDRLTLELEQISNDKSIDDAFAKISRLKKVLEYLKEHDEYSTLEKQLPHIAELSASIVSSKETTSRLQGLINMFREVALEYGKETGTSELNNLSSSIDQYFSKLVRHPIFKKIQIVSEKNEPPTYSFLAVGDQGTSYIQTRLSNAQKNAAAISLFLANNEKLGIKFDVILMDDPTQSMDTEHKEALAEVVSELAKSKQIMISTEDSEFHDLLLNKHDSTKVYTLDNWTIKGPMVVVH